MHVMELGIKYQKWNSGFPAAWFAAGELGRANLSCWVPSSCCAYLFGTVVLQLFVAPTVTCSTLLLQTGGVNSLCWQGKPHVFSLNNGNIGCRVRISAVLGFCQKYLSALDWSTAKARRFSHLGAEERCFAGNAADRFISDSRLLFFGLTLSQGIFLRCSVTAFIL